MWIIELLFLRLLSPVLQNTAMHLAAINGHPIVVDFFLSNSRAEIVKNANNDNILDIAARSEEREVAAVIAKHDRLVIEWFLIQCRNCLSTLDFLCFALWLVSKLKFALYVLRHQKKSEYQSWLASAEFKNFRILHHDWSIVLFESILIGWNKSVLWLWFNFTQLKRPHLFLFGIFNIILIPSPMQCRSFETTLHLWHNIHFRWDEVLRRCSTALVPLMKKFIERMPEVAVVSPWLIKKEQFGSEFSLRC